MQQGPIFPQQSPRPKCSRSIDQELVALILARLPRRRRFIRPRRRLREVAGFLFGLLLLCPHSIQLRLIEHDLERIVPAQIRVLFEDRLHSGFQVLGDLDLARLELALQFLEFFAQLVAAMECLIRLAEQVIVRDHLLEAIVLQLALDHCDQGIAGHGVKLDALVEQDGDLRVGRAILSELIAQDVSRLSWSRRRALAQDPRCRQAAARDRSPRWRLKTDSAGYRAAAFRGS